MYYGLIEYCNLLLYLDAVTRPRTRKGACCVVPQSDWPVHSLMWVISVSLGLPRGGLSSILPSKPLYSTYYFFFLVGGVVVKVPLKCAKSDKVTNICTDVIWYVPKQDLCWMLTSSVFLSRAFEVESLLSFYHSTLNYIIFCCNYLCFEVHASHPQVNIEQAYHLSSLLSFVGIMSFSDAKKWARLLNFYCAICLLLSNSLSGIAS